MVDIHQTTVYFFELYCSNNKYSSFVFIMRIMISLVTASSVSYIFRHSGNSVFGSACHLVVLTPFHLAPTTCVPISS